jgi:hypothetical protein
MAVYQGTRIRTAGIPMGARPIAARRPRRIPARAQRGLRSIGVALAAILIVFVLSLVYLTQTLQSGVTRHQIDNVLLDRTALQQELQSQLGTVAHGASEQVVTTWAGLNRLVRLGNTVVRVPAR